MAVTGISFTSSAARLCNYLLRGEAHDGSGERRYLLASGVGVFPPTAARQFAVIRGVHGQRGVKRQAASVFQSFSEQEFNLSDPAAVELVHDLGLEFARRAFPGHPCLVVTQRDGKSGLLHNHVVVSGVSDRGAELVYRRKARAGSVRDKIAALNSPDGRIEAREERPAGRAFSSAMGNKWRIAHVNDELLADVDFMHSLGIEPYDNRELMKAPAEKVIKDDLAKREDGRYVWRDDLRSIIERAQAEATTVEKLRDLLAVQRVELRQRGKKGHFSYGFIDAAGKQRQARALGARGLGESYGREATVWMLERNHDVEAKAAQQPRQPAPRGVLEPSPASFPHSDPSDHQTVVEVDQESVDEIALRLRRRLADRKPKTPARQRHLARAQRQPQRDREYGD